MLMIFAARMSREELVFDKLRVDFYE